MILSSVRKMGIHKKIIQFFFFNAKYVKLAEIKNVYGEIKNVYVPFETNKEECSVKESDWLLDNNVQPHTAGDTQNNDVIVLSGAVWSPTILYAYFNFKYDLL